MEAAFVDVLKSLGTAIASGIVALVLGYLVFKPAMAGRRIESRKLDFDAQKATAEEAQTERAQIRQDMQFLLSEMRAERSRMEERDRQNQAKIDALNDASRASEERASRDRLELRGVIDKQSVKIGWLTRRVEQLIRAFNQTGTEAPLPLEPPPPE